MGTDVTEFGGSLEVPDDGAWRMVLQLPAIFKVIRASGRPGVVEAWVAGERIMGTIRVKRPEAERG